tara:strand:+ start:1597 stop:2484 length:888 start_codon:yes stop_codon:yes gene_type:complete
LEHSLLRKAYIPPGAGMNFIAFQCLHLADISKVINYKSHVNEYSCDFQKSTLWPFWNVSEINEFETLYPDIVSRLESFRNKMSKEKFIELALKHRITTAGLEQVQGKYYWLPIHDYSIFFLSFYGKDPEFDAYLDELMSLCWKIHKDARKDLISIGHYELPRNNYNVDTMQIDIEDCEEFVSDLLYVKHLTPVLEDEPLPDVATEPRKFIRHKKANVDITISYRKIFMEQNVKELTRLYAFFGIEDYFHVNVTEIVKAFREYNLTNLKLISSFDFSSAPGYDKPFLEAWAERYNK